MGRVRRRGTDGVSQRGSSLELFYDLVFVFAITQVSHLLLEHLTWTGVLQSLIALLAVYWSWNYTTWTTNELEDRKSTRLNSSHANISYAVFCLKKKKRIE